VIPREPPKPFKFVVAFLVVIIPFGLIAYLAFNMYKSKSYVAEYNLPLDIKHMNDSRLSMYIEEESPNDAFIEEKSPDDKAYLGIIKSPFTIKWRPEYYPVGKKVSMNLRLKGDGDWYASVTCNTCVEKEKNKWRKIEYVGKRQSSRAWTNAVVAFEDSDFIRLKDPSNVTISIRSRAIEIHEEKTSLFAEVGFVPVSAFDKYWLWSRAYIETPVKTAHSVSDWMSQIIPTGSTVMYNPEDIKDTGVISDSDNRFYLQLMSDVDSYFAVTTATYKVLPQVGRISLTIE
jgi:hypothetical protein